MCHHTGAHRAVEPQRERNSAMENLPVQWWASDEGAVLNHPDVPQASLLSQLKPGVRYITSMSYGGHANQFIGIQNLLHLGKLLNRVVIIPTLTPLHFQGLPQDMSTFYDLDYFYEKTSIPIIEQSTLKRWNFTDPPPLESVTCWSVLEAVADGRNVNDGSMAVHNIDIKYYPLPPLSRASEETKIWTGAIHEFDSNPRSKGKWITRVRDELLPHDDIVGDDQKTAAGSPSLKSGFDPRNNEPPSDQLFCLDTTFFLGSRMFPPAYPSTPPIEPLRPYEGEAWMQAGQHLRFSSRLETLAEEYLKKLFGVSKLNHIPPFITCHIRRGDFAEERGLTSLDQYTDAVQRVRERLEWRMDNMKGRNGLLKGGDYQVVVATDEAPNSEFVRILKEELRWKVIDHDFMETERKLGAWYTLLIDSVILSRGRGFVGTEFSTFSYLAGLRVKYWNGGVEEWTTSL
ncbi:O-fucosyltransferase family protein [Sporobolomyces salmoneus]|uniref:O-fucosyltransferase family protein n=1 Tax=Sporobolomyces salmoneus TaxID=183962 RepID=UPI003177F5DA